MSVNLILASEIFSNAHNLEFIVYQHPDSLLWSFSIALGPRSHGKVVISGEHHTTKQDAVDAILSVLEVIITKCNKVIACKAGDNLPQVLPVMLNPEDSLFTEMMNKLIPQMLPQIKKELEEKSTCSTAAWLTLLQNEDTFAIGLVDDWSVVFDQAVGKDQVMAMIQRNVPRLKQPKADRFIAQVSEYYA